MTETKTSKKVPVIVYIASGLSIVPFWGTFIGLLSLITGQTIYKSRALTIVGSIGIVISLTLYGGLYYFGKIQRGGLFDKQSITLAGASLKMLTEQIELFKLKTGRYPQNLEEATKDNYTQLHIDPILDKISDENETSNFYYRVDSDGYFLFSVGFDKTPFTADDIYPILTDNEKNRFGIKTLEKKPSP